MNKSALLAILFAFVAGLALGAVALNWLSSDDHSDHEVADGASAEREILYYRHPHNPRVTSDVPRKDEMGMDYIPIYADQGGSGGGIFVAPEVTQSLGVRTRPVERMTMEPVVEAVGYVDYDETRLSHVHVRAEGWVERLHARSLGQRVRQGELLLEFFSPTIVNAQEEFLRALTMNQPAVRDAARERLLSLGLSRQTVQQIERDGRVRQLIPVYARQDGIVTELNIREGMYITPGMDILTISDLSSVWVLVEVFEHQARLVKTGQVATLQLSPGDDALQGQVEFIYPSLDSSSRALRARLSVANPDGTLKPGMFARAAITTESRPHVLAIPRQALIRSDNTQRVIVARDEGRFEAVEVRTGLMTADTVEITAGLQEGERVVISAQFLIDSESSLRGAFTRLETLEELQPGDEVWSDGIYKGPGRNPGSINLSHEPIPALGWPAMTMDLDLIEGLSVPDHLQPGDAFAFALEALDEITFRIVALRIHGEEVRP